VIHRLPRAAAPLLLSCLGLAFSPLALLCLSAGCGGGASDGTAASTARQETARHESAPKQAENAPDAFDAPFPLPVIELAGTDEQIGAELGRLLGGAIRAGIIVHHSTPGGAQAERRSTPHGQPPSP